MREPMAPRPLSSFTGAVKAVFTDLDGTLTEGQRLPSTVVAAIEKLHQRGVPVVIVSGRPAGWADCLTRLLPLTAMIFENGAGFCWREGKKVTRVDLAGDAEANRKKLNAVYQSLHEKHGPLRLASDQPFRIFDLAIDVCEEGDFLPKEKIQNIFATLAQHPEIHAKLSSIHINYWVGAYDKRTAVEALLKKMFLRKEDVVFTGDSPNDEPLFHFFPTSVGMKNLETFLPTLSHPPAFIATKSEGEGFLETLEKFFLVKL